MFLISVQLLEMELVPFRKKIKNQKRQGKKEKRWKPPFFCRKQTKDVIVACLKISSGELHCGTCSQATQSRQTCLWELLTSLNLLFRPWPWRNEGLPDPH